MRARFVRVGSGAPAWRFGRFKSSSRCSDGADIPHHAHRALSRSDARKFARARLTLSPSLTCVNVRPPAASMYGTHPRPLRQCAAPPSAYVS